MTPRELEDRLQVSKSWLKRSDIPSLSLGRLRRYLPAAVEEYLGARTSGNWGTHEVTATCGRHFNDEEFVPTQKKRPDGSFTSATAIIRASARQRSRALVSGPGASPRRWVGLEVRQLMTPAQVTKRLQVSESWLKRSDIPFLKLGRLRRYDAAVVEQFISARLAS